MCLHKYVKIAPNHFQVCLYKKNSKVSLQKRKSRDLRTNRNNEEFKGKNQVKVE